LPAGDADVANAGQRRAKGAPLGRELRVEVRIAGGTEREPFLLAIDNQPHRDALHAPGAQSGLDLLPQHRRERVSVETIKDAAAFLRTSEVVVDIVRFAHRLIDRLLRNLVED